MTSANEPFAVEHFRKWASGLILDNGHHWLLEDWELAFADDLFVGRPENWLVVPEGNGKTTFVGGIALYHAEFTPDAWVPVAASSRDQARIVYRQASGFVRRTERLGAGRQPFFRCFDGYRRIDCKTNGAQIEVFAGDDRTGDGVIPTLCILDELHRHRSLDLYETWRGKLGKRHGQLLTISTAGEPGSEFEQAVERILGTAAILEQNETFVRVATEQVVLHRHAVPESGDVTNFELVARANPFSEITAEVLAEKYATPTMTLAHWRRFTCNLPTQEEGAAISPAEWAACANGLAEPGDSIVRIGVDLGWKEDCTALVPHWITDGIAYLGVPVILKPAKDIGLRKDAVLLSLGELAARYGAKTVVIDPENDGEVLAQDLEDQGFRVIAHSQKPGPMALAAERFYAAVREKTIRHPSDPGLTQHVLNGFRKSTIEGTWRFVKASKQSPKHIDALIAAAMVHSVAIDPRPTTPLVAWA